MRSFLLCLTALSIGAFSASCNTTVGLGRDMRILGEEMERAAANRQGGGTEDYTGAPVY